MKRQRQEDRLLAALKRRRMTTGEIVSQLGIGRPAAVVYLLRRLGHDIRSENKSVRNRYGGHSTVAEYRLVQAKKKRSAA